MPMKLDDGKRKIKWTIFLIVFLLMTLLPAPHHLVFENPVMVRIDSRATKYVDEGLARAGSAFILSRTLNAVISVFQESELQLEPGGIGVSVALGQSLDPINDMVERFSWVMLASLTSLGIQKILIQVGAWLSISIVLSLGLLFLLSDLWLRNIISIDLRRAGRTLVLLAVLIRFAVPVMAFLNNQVYESVLKGKYEESSAIIGKSANELNEFNASDIAVSQQNEQEMAEQKNDSWLSKANGLVKKTMNVLDLKGKYEAIKNITSGIFEHLVNLIVVFVINTILFPLLFLWGFLKLCGLLVGQRFGQSVQSIFMQKISPNKESKI